MNREISIEPLDVNNWLKVSKLSVSDEQKKVFPVTNVYWIGISRYDEHTELFAIKQGSDYVGLIGCGYDEDGISGYINPLMVDKVYQRQGIAESAVRLIITHLSESYKVKEIHLGHRKANTPASILYQKLGFKIIKETDTEYLRSLKLED